MRKKKIEKYKDKPDLLDDLDSYCINIVLKYDGGDK